MSFSITYKRLFCIAAFILLVSRILLLTGNYFLPIDAVLLEMLYLCFVTVITLMANRYQFRLKRGPYLYILTVLLAHTVLWGLVFTDLRFVELITSHFKSQIMFVVILCVTVWAIQRLQAEQEYMTTAYFALSGILLLQLVRNYTEIDLSNLRNIFTATQRTRANFGFGHFNTLGGACVCNLLLIYWHRNRKRNLLRRSFNIVMVCVSVCMLLCSASRSSLTSIILFFMVYYYISLDYSGQSKRTIWAIRICLCMAALLLFLWAYLGFSFSDFLESSQRIYIFTRAIPTFFSAGKLGLGLGYASSVHYATALTPYTTYWMDNAYVYYMITTGFLGLILIMSALVMMVVELKKGISSQAGRILFSAFVLYLYVSCFEVFLFDSGNCLNYIYLPWFLAQMTKKHNTV